MLRGMDKDITTLLREIKDASGLSEPRIAAQLGTSQPTVNRILNGQGDCKGRTFKAIADMHARVVGAGSNPPASTATNIPTS
jgi:predicted transcriptional regulator